MDINIKKICDIAVKAGYLALARYNENTGEDSEQSKSISAVAGKESHRLIKEGLIELYPDIPIISDEEKDISYDEMSQIEYFWFIDPIDGIKEFINKVGDFTVNIALIKGRAPILGVIYIPVDEIIYYAEKGNGAWKKSKNKKPVQINTSYTTPEEGLVLLKSRSHPSLDLKRFVSNFFINKAVPMGSSKKFCVLAEGKADIYPRLTPTGEWDTAAGQCIVEEAGGLVVDINHKPISYKKRQFINDNFIVYSSINTMLFKPKSENIPIHHATIQRKHMEELNKHRSCIIWLTGLSGSGKSTLAHAIQEQLHYLGCRSFVLDGDNVRHGLNKDLGFSVFDRQENIRRIGEVTKLMMESGMIVLAAFISPYKRDRYMVRKLIPEGDFIEIYCACSLEICEKRDVKGHYKKARAGEIIGFTGISSPYEEPENPELTLNTGETLLSECVDEVIKYLMKASFI